MKCFTSLLIALVLTFSVFATAYAAPPETITINYEDVYPLVDCGELGVGDFTIYNHEVGSLKYQDFFDQDGNWIREKIHIQGNDHLYAEGYPDKVAEVNFVWNMTGTRDPITGYFIFSHERGNVWHINLPGYGNVFHIAGLADFVWDFDAEMWHPIKEVGLRATDWEPLCEYLAPSP